jgi:hypothetical protein
MERGVMEERNSENSPKKSARYISREWIAFKQSNSPVNPKSQKNQKNKPVKKAAKKSKKK